MTRILSTKILKPSQKQFLLNAGFSVVEADFIRVTALPFELNEIADNLIITSQNAVHALSAHPDVQEVRRKPVFCIGPKTADLLDEIGFTVQETADNGADLAKIILQNYPSESFTFFSGSLRRDEMPAALLGANVALNEITLYKTESTPHKVGQFEGVLFFSPSAVQSFLSVNNMGSEVCFCIGQTTSKALENITGNIVVANQPTVENTIIQTINYFGRTSKIERPNEAKT